MLEILSCGGPLGIQDLGRPSYRHLGVPLSGALDPDWLAIANALAGNTLGAAALEMRLAGPTLRAEDDIDVAIAGVVDAHLDRREGNKSVAAWRGHRLHRGDVLHIGAIRSGVAYLAVAGGVATNDSLGSRSTYPRAGLGGIDGRAPLVGDRLPVGAGDPAKVRPGGTAPLLELRHPPVHSDEPLRILRGPQQDRFTTAAWHALLEGEFTVSHEADRMGLRLDGPKLGHIGSADIVSEAVTPGVIQVPGDGRAIVLLADCQTVGGYPKIATVIAADLPRLGHALPGSRLRFAEVTLEQALAARREAASRLDAAIASIVPLTEGLDLNALYAANLIDGVIHAH